MSETTGSYMLDVQNLNKKFGNVHAVTDLSFNVKKGEVFGFLGPNGAGKSTTMRIITGFIPASSGSITVDGLDYREDSFKIRQNIGYLPESTPLYNDMQVYEYLKFVGGIRGLKGKVLNTAVDKMLELCDITKMVKRQLGKLSKGYRQRVGLAQAMIHNPRLLILDEPMSGLDPNQIRDIREVIKDIGREKTVIYCSHILSEVSETCNTVMIIKEGGRKVAFGTPKELHDQYQGNIYSLRAKGDSALITQTLSSLSAVQNATVDYHDNDWSYIKISVDSQEEIGEEILKLAYDNKWAVSELRHDTAGTNSLEQIFTSLTRS